MCGTLLISKVNWYINIPFCFCILLMSFEWGKKMCCLLLQGCSSELGWCAMQRSRKALLERRAIQEATSGRNYLYKVSLSLVFVLWGLVFLFSLCISHGHGYGGIVYFVFLLLALFLAIEVCCVCMRFHLYLALFSLVDCFSIINNGCGRWIHSLVLWLSGEFCISWSMCSLME